MAKSMVKPNALVVESGNLIERKEVLKWLKAQQKKYHLTLYIGAGEQINQAFKAAGYKIKFCPLGRVCDTLEERQLCEQIARENQAIIQDQLDRNGISARVMIPFDSADDVLTPLNGDLIIFFRYLGGYDKIFRLTTAGRVKDKKRLRKRAAWAFAPIAGKIKKNRTDMKLSKIEVIGF